MFTISPIVHSVTVIRIYPLVSAATATGPNWLIEPQEAQARFARARLCLPYNEGRKEGNIETKIAQTWHMSHETIFDFSPLMHFFHD
jgi:hypothetical protein